MSVFDRLRPALSELHPYSPKPAPPIKLDANESPWPLSADARVRMAHVLATEPLHRYPDARASDLRGALALRIGCDPEALVLGSGSDEIISILHTAMARGDAPPTVLYPGPSFVMYRINALTHGLHPIEVPLKGDFSLDVDAMVLGIEEHDPALVYYATPNNPTGNAFEPEVLQQLVEAFPNTLHVIDEAYGPFRRDDGVIVSERDWVQDFPQAAIMGTLSKIGLAGLRVGWLECDPALAAEFEKVRQPFNLDRLAQRAATFALEELAPDLEMHLRSIVEARETLRAALTELELHVWPSDANFLLVDHERAELLAEQLRSDGIGVRVFTGHPRLTGRVRVTVGTPAENEALLEALRKRLPALS